MSKKTRNIALVAIIIAGFLGLGYIWKNYGSVPNPSEAPKLSKMTNGKIQLDGIVAPENTADLGFVVSATIKSIQKGVGDVVKKGDILATEENSDLTVQISSAQANEKEAQINLDKLKHDLKKEKLKVHGLSGNAKKQQQAQVSSSEDSVDAQEVAISVAHLGVVSAQAQLAKTVLRAPFDGIVTRQDGDAGEVSGEFVAPFMTITSNSPFNRIEANASDLDVAKIKVGDKAQASFDIFGSQKTMNAKVVRINPAQEISEGKLKYKIYLLLDSTDEKLKLGMHASVIF